MSVNYLDEQTRAMVIADFLGHEAKKPAGPIYRADLCDVAMRTSQTHADVLAILRARCDPQSAIEDVRALLGRLTLEDRWRLFHAVSCGGLKKDLFNCVGNPGFDWALQSTPLRQTSFESKVGCLRDVQTRPIKFLEALEFIKSRGGASDDLPHVHGDPLIGRDEKGQVLVHDGNGRLLSYAFRAISGAMTVDDRISVWVGRKHTQADDYKSAYEDACRTIFLKN